MSETKPTNEIIIEQIDVDDVFYYKKEKYNSNNHWDGPNGKPDDYESVLEKTQTKYWIDQFHKFYVTINIEKRDLKWMKEASHISQMTQKVSRIHKDEIEEAIENYGSGLEFLFSQGQKWFVRSDTVSLKNGIHKEGPYTSMKQIIESLVTCKMGHSPVEIHTKELKLYLMPWREDLEFHSEFRVFVCENKLTAISQQHLYTTNEILKPLGEEERKTKIHEWIETIQCVFDKTIKNRITTLDSYVMDIDITKDGKPYFIEINCFGKEYASGASLFHWILDEFKLYGRVENTVFFRYAI